MSEFYQCLRFSPYGISLQYLSVEEARSGVVRREVSIITGDRNSIHYKLYVRSRAGGRNYTYGSMPTLRGVKRLISHTLQFHGRRDDVEMYDEAILMKFIDETFSEPISMDVNDPVVKLYWDKLGIVVDEFRPTDTIEIK